MWLLGSKHAARHKERRRAERRGFPHYLPFKNEQTGELVGHLADISLRGFRLESLRPIQNETELPLRIEVPPDIAPIPHMVFTARSRWSLPDRIDPTTYNVGFEIVDMRPEDGRLFGLIFDRYGSSGAASAAKGDYLWGN